MGKYSTIQELKKKLQELTNQRDSISLSGEDYLSKWNLWNILHSEIYTLKNKIDLINKKVRASGYVYPTNYSILKKIGG